MLGFRRSSRPDPSTRNDPKDQAIGHLTKAVVRLAYFPWILMGLILVIGLVYLTGIAVRLSVPFGGSLSVQPSPPKSITIPIQGTGRMANVTGRAIEKDGQARIELSFVPPPSPDHVYIVWVIDSAGMAHSAGILTPSSSGEVSSPLRRRLDDAVTVAVTEEPWPGGNQRPTGKPEVVGPP
jgi:anti-sigma-K factor RskA